MPGVVLCLGLHVGDGDEFRVRQLLPDGIGGKSEYFGLAGIAGKRECLHESARAIAPVAIVEAQGIARIGEFIDWQAPVEARPNARAAENLIGARADSAAGGNVLRRAALPGRLPWSR